MSDANKLPLTKKINEGASLYLKERGFKPIETEVFIQKGWVADIAGVCVPTRTEAIKMKLLKSKPQSKYDKIILENGRCQYKLNKERSEKRDLWEAQYQKIESPLTAIIEVKISRGDWKKDKKWSLNPPANINYLAIPNGLLKKEEFPKGWWVLECNDDGKVRKCSQIGNVFNISEENKMWLIYNIAHRRANRTDYQYWRELNKQIRDNQNKRENLRRMSKVIKAILDIVEGKTIEESFLWNGIKCKLSKSDMDRLKKITNAF
jgi:hypothetical protein